MEKVPLKDLKMRLSYWAERASKGETIEVTNHNVPYIRLVSPYGPGVIVGSKVGQPLPKSPVKTSITLEKILECLEEDRSED